MPNNNSTSQNDLSATAVQAINSKNAKAEGSLQAMSSDFAKMKITPYEVKNGKREYAEAKKVIINPESYSRQFVPVGSNPKKVASGANHEQKIVEFVETVNFDLWFDSTGAIPDSEDVTKSVKWLVDNLVKYDGSMHATRYAQLLWGSLAFWGQLKSLNIQYLFFSRTGAPLRAKASLSFQSITEPDIKEAEKNKTSPDLTHMRIVRAGDNLPAMCYQIYNDPSYYLMVAEANGLANFTNVQPGQKIYFPPLKT